VLVRLKAATLNYRDLLIVKGGYGSRQKFPLVLLSDGAGLIEAAGSGVREFAVGDRVIGSFFAAEPLPGGTMSKPLIVSIPHCLGKDEELRRLKNGLGGLCSFGLRNLSDERQMI
jgi:NADPH:quinone reductase-like Zn-dependent oxidoreductase